MNNVDHSLSRWTVVHELGHSWDAYYDWKLSEGLEKFTGGHTGPIRAPIACDNPAKPGCNTSYYMAAPPQKAQIRISTEGKILLSR